MTAPAESDDALEDWFARRRHPGSGAALTSLVLAATWFSLALLPSGRWSDAVPEAVWGALWAGLLPLSGLVSLWSLAADPRRNLWRWMVVVTARAWALALSSEFVLLVLHLGVRGETSDAEIAPDQRPAWMLWTEWGVTAGIILLLGLAAGMTVKRLPLHSPRHRVSRARAVAGEQA